MNAVPAYVDTVLAALRTAGFEAYPVGGCVRDGLLGRQPGDWDVCTSAPPARTAEVFADCRVIETGMKHGTVTVLSDGRPVEITTFRTESGYGDGRHPDDVTFVRSLREDLARRDFTVNAMALDADGSVIDPFGGRADLRAGLIRCVGDPAERFSEDALRILRALRFASRLGFSVEPGTAAAVHAQRGRLSHISRGRVLSELRGLLVGAGAGAVLREFADVIFECIPELRAEYGFRQQNPNHIHDIWTHTTMAVDAIAPDAVLRMTMLLHDVGKPACFFTDEAGVGHFYGHAGAGARTADDILRRLRCDNASREEIVRLIEYHDIEPPQTKKGVRRLLTRLGEPFFRRLILCWRADSDDRAEHIKARNLGVIGETERLLDELAAAESCFSLADLAVRGGDLLAAGMRPGPEIGRILKELFRLVTEEGVPNERDTLLALAERM